MCRMASGIYAIIHRDSGRWYVGQSKNIRKRLNEHRRLLRDGWHHSSYLQNAWDKYGPDAFDFDVLILAPVWMLDDLEQAYLDDPEASEFNVARCAEAPARGRTLTPEHKAKIGAAGVGRIPTTETREKMSAWQRGRKFSDETRAKISAANTGHRLSLEHRAKISAAHKGRELTPEHRAKISAAHTGKKGHRASPETRAKLSAAHKGRKIAPETIEKRRATRAANRRRSSR